MKNRNFWLAMTALAVVAGILYSSWPLGYWLNPVISQQSLASGLEAVGQPYNWVFIGGDISSSLLVIVLAILLWRRLKQKLVSQPLLKLALLSLVAFSLGTIIDALLPERCQPGVLNCPSWQHNNLLLAHGLFSIGASFALFVSLVAIWWRHRFDPLLNGLMVGYLLFGAVSLVEAIAPGKGGNWSQHYYITLCSLWVALIPYAMRRTFAARQQVNR